MPHILIVEDDTDINNSTAAYLRRRGCVCTQAFSGTEGRLLWQAGGIDLLLVDLMLAALLGWTDRSGKWTRSWGRWACPLGRRSR